MAGYDLIVVGGGPAGMMAAGRAAERGRRVLLLEKGPSLGRKLLITAGGRCNITNSAALPEFLKAFGRQGEFLRDAFKSFSNLELLAWLHSRKIETIEERKGRIFPASQDARDILRALMEFMAAAGAEAQTQRPVEKLWIEGGALRGVVARGRIESASVLLATGGLSYPATGCTGDGYALARAAGHSIAPTFPAVVAFETVETWPREIQGTPIKNVQLRATCGERKVAEIFGEALWTHYGISGPAVLDISREIVPALAAGEPVTLRLDLRPNDTEEALDERLLFAIKKDGKKQVQSVLGDWVAARTATTLLRLAEVDAKKKMNQVSKSDRKRIVRTVKHLELHLARPRPIEEAIVTGGGVALSEVDPRRMESRLLKGLHFAGELLDLAGPSGGYNLQAAFSTGYLVGEIV